MDDWSDQTNWSRHEGRRNDSDILIRTWIPYFLVELNVKSKQAREFADLSRECPKRAKSNPENPKQDSSQENDSDANECTESELKMENEMVATIYKIKLAELKDENDGWDLREVLEMYIKAGKYYFWIGGQNDYSSKLNHF